MRYHLKFSVLLLLALLTVLCLVFSFVGATLQAAKAERQHLAMIGLPDGFANVNAARVYGYLIVAASLTSADAAPCQVAVTVEPLPAWREWVLSWFDDYSSQVTEIQVTGAAFDDAKLAAVAKIRSLRALEIHGSSITDEAFANFCRQSSVQNILLGDNAGLSQSSYELAKLLNQTHNYQRLSQPLEIPDTST